MRRLVLILMIALLPLRGWLGEAMAMEMLTPQLSAMQNVAIAAGNISASAHFVEEMQADLAPCPDHAESAENRSDHTPAHCGTCPLCQMCHTVAAPAPWVVPLPLWIAQGKPAAGQAHFASAPASFALKPPIS